MAIKNTNNEWLSAVKHPHNYSQKGKFKKTTTLAGRCSRSPLSEICMQFPSRNYTDLHQTRLSTFFKKKARKKKKESVASELHATEDEESNVNTNKEITSISCDDNNRLLDISGFDTQSMSPNEMVQEEEVENKNKNVTYDEEALFGTIGDSLSEEIDGEEHVSSDDSGNDSDMINDMINEETESQLSPCVVSKYRTVADKSRCKLASSCEMDSIDSCQEKPQNKTNQCNYFKPLNMNFKKPCVKNLSLKKNSEDMYISRVLSKYGREKDNSSEFGVDNENGSRVQLDSSCSECLSLNNQSYNHSSESLSYIEPPSLIVFSNHYGDELLNDEDGTAENSENDVISVPSLLQFTEENTNNDGGGDSGDSGLSCYGPPSPLYLTECAT